MEAAIPAKRQGRILIVAQEPALRELADKALAKDFTIISSRTASEADNFFAQDSFDVVIADHRLPDTSGIGLLEKARARVPLAHRVLVATIMEAPSLFPAIEHGDVHRCLSRPVSVFELGECVRSLVAGARQGRAVIIHKDSHASDLSSLSKNGLVVESAQVLDSVEGISLAVLVEPPDLDGVRTAASCLGGVQKKAALLVALAADELANASAYVAAGADDVIASPVDSAEVLTRFEVWQGRRAQRAELLRLRQEVLAEQSLFNIIGRSQPMSDLFSRIERVAPTDSSILLSGETGTGKELVARAIHHASPRRDAPFVAINLSAIPENLVESELFGHEAGAFTGAKNSRPGRLELVTGGTLFLDEVGDLPEQVQVKLLRVLQERVFERVGSSSPRTADFRLISATHREMDQRVRDGVFRDDLYYRLNVVELTIPALRDRTEDIPLLAHYFLEVFSRRANIRDLSFSEAGLAELSAHTWPGNVRELEHAVERSVVLSRHGDVIGAGIIKQRSQRKPFQAIADQCLDSSRSLEEIMQDFERTLIKQVLEREGGNQAATARRLKLPRQTLQSRLQKLGLS